MTKIRSKFLFIYFLLGFAISSLNSFAQLKANFTVDNASGCSPLSVKFTNTTTGTSSTTTWTWNLGNGNSSALFEPGAIYRTEQKYTVTLTAKDGANTSVKSMDIFVYKKPTIDFSVSPSSGCIPLNVSFTANATAGDGTIAEYVWDYGDGKTEQGAGLQKTSHIYTEAQTPPITLTVTNNYGCYSTLTKTNLIDASGGVKAAFTASALTVCNVGDNITFTNNSTGSGVLSYSWDFGDGKTSTEQSPVHSFAGKGSFIVKLTTKSSNGCSATADPITVSVANFTADFDIPSLLCQNTDISFINKGSKPFDKAEWWLDNNTYASTSYSGDFLRTFYQTGEHTLKLINHYGSCSATVTKNFTIVKTPQSNGFIATLQSSCGTPVVADFKDTSSNVTKWEWRADYWSAPTFSTTQNASYIFTSGISSSIYLKVTNSEGCSSNMTKYVYYGKPNVTISAKKENGTSNTLSGCGDITLTFSANPDSIMKDFKWNFGDGSAISTQRNPTHTFSVAGSYTVTLEYSTINGCKGTSSYPQIRVVDVPTFDFSSTSGTTICGNTPVILAVSPAAYSWSYHWSFNNDYTNDAYGSAVTKKFTNDTTYTVRLISSSEGCQDTIIKTNYLTVLPAFPKIGAVTNTCADTRGEVTFTDESKKVGKWSWNFGDGSPVEEYTTYKQTVKHLYTKSGTYKVVLTATNGACAVKDSVYAYVLLKQNPIVTATKTEACGSDVINIKLSGYDINPYTYLNSYYNSYSISSMQYGDLTNANAFYNLNTSNWQTETSGTIRNFNPGKNDLRIITTSGYFGCRDTTNFIPVKIHGPIADFKKENHSGCFKDPVNFTDLSTPSGNSSIVKWEWNFGDGTTTSSTTGGSVRHLYNAPGSYYVSLKVTDIDGCITETNTYSHNIIIGGPKADFTVYSSVAYYSYTVPPNTLVTFYNNSASFDYYSSLKWIFSDGTTSTRTTPTFTFTDAGSHVVTLVTTNSQTGCTDTIKKTITVRKVNSIFNYRLSYINNNSCPPVLATFTSLSTNSVRVSWSFGDGGIAADQKTVSHTYTEPGIYRVVHYSYDVFNNVDSTEDVIEVRGPYALLKADKLSGCTTLDVKVDAEVKYANTYTWDFGDGTLIPTTDVFATHTYQTPGIYIPALILKDVGGCSSTSELPDKIVVDSLHINFSSSVPAICDAALVTFIPEVASLSKSLLQTTLQYRWIIKENNISDTLYTETASHTFSETGNHSVSLTVTSPYGCEKQLTKSVTVKSGIKVSISGTDKICEGETATFTGTATPSSGDLTWKWKFDNGTTAETQNPSAQLFNTAGQKAVELIVDNGNCPDTARHILQVIGHPVITITPASPFVCKDRSIQLTASGGNDYQWTAIGNILNASTPVITINPMSDQHYYVTVKNEAGCSSTDSVMVKVINPFEIVSAPTLFSCEGDPVQLHVSGADAYKWSPADGLDNIQSATPLLTTKANTTLTVVGYDTYNCFTDTAIINVNISKRPSVNAGPDQQLISGAETTLHATVSSNAVSWKWEPVDFLSCSDCLSPISKPTSSVNYVLTATNSDGCKATDEVKIQLICKSGLIYIPTAFSPNQDNLNDRFGIHGEGIKSIKHFIIYDRWGRIIFNKSEINAGDLNSTWDGTFNGETLPTGNYIYSIQIECAAGDIFNYKGSVLLIR
ncbi:PKD domain-containing protein [Ferruginibacter lapsinanis]|uniref:PKD domain-containing protein n=1 Tax=Ferruginibacter lapsinanis TaxID=563172 RepID=UPI001E608F74|nr:PKD domain-containing protein [Ferruginibacter lapsinanis]UEG50497.1 PKD domain-containing protein [Ferruginibacter lapsinanis]